MGMSGGYFGDVTAQGSVLPKIMNRLESIIWIGLDTASGKEVFQIPVNKKLRLRAIPIAGKPTFQTPENNSQLQTIVNEINQYGLQIIDIESYDPQ